MAAGARKEARVLVMILFHSAPQSTLSISFPSVPSPRSAFRASPCRPRSAPAVPRQSTPRLLPYFCRRIVTQACPLRPTPPSLLAGARRADARRTDPPHTAHSFGDLAPHHTEPFRPDRKSTRL